MNELLVNQTKMVFGLLSMQTKLMVKYWEGFAEGLKSIEKDVKE